MGKRKNPRTTQTSGQLEKPLRKRNPQTTQEEIKIDDRSSPIKRNPKSDRSTNGPVMPRTTHTKRGSQKTDLRHSAKPELKDRLEQKTTNGQQKSDTSKQDISDLKDD